MCVHINVIPQLASDNAPHTAMHAPTNKKKGGGSKGDSGGGGGGMSLEAEAAVIRSGVVALNKQLHGLRDSLISLRESHNTFNEMPKYSF
jgi:hypothetical protein